MKIGFDFTTGQVIKDEDKSHVESEDNAIKLIMDDLGITDYSIEKYCDNYTSLLYKGFVLFRIKYTSNTKWIKIIIFNDMNKEYQDNDLFAAQRNKKEAYWKSTIVNLLDYKEVLLKAIKNIEAQKKN